ncbi:translocation/assembly module TamB domain-containing protein [Denitrobaculum tricleocarpae]|nr:translocation/assembly module TamB domain-containing protein [Denitrobaculum tricleocarpae]
MSRKRLLITSLLALPLLVLAAVGALLFLGTQTDLGRDMLRQQAEALISEEDGLKLSLGKIDGSLLSDFKVARIALADKDGEWLIAEDLTVGWSPWELLNKRLSIAEVKLGSLEILREPHLPPSPASSDDGSGDTIPSLPVDVALQTLQIDRIRLHEALAGQEAVFRLGLSLNAPSEDRIRSEIDLRQLEGGEAMLAGLVEFHPVKDTLGVDITLSEPENGLLARTLELPGLPAVELTILGDGAITSWQGQLLAKAGDLLESELIVSTALDGSPEAREITIGLQGSSGFAALLPPEFAPLVAPRLNIESELTWSESNRTLQVASTSLQSPALRVRLEGSYALAEEAIAAKISLTPLNNEVLEPLITPAEFQTGQLDITATGDLQSIKADIEFLFEGPELNELSAQRLDGRFQTMLSPLRPEKLPLEGTARLTSLSGLPPEANALLGEQVDLDYRLQFDAVDNRVDLAEVNASGTGFSLSGMGEFGLETQAADADISLLLTDLSLLAPAVGQAIAGQLKIDAKLNGEDITQQAAIEIRAVSEQLNPGDPQLKALLGESIEMEATLDTTPETLALRSLDLTTASARLAATAEVPLTFERVAADFQVNADDLSSLEALIGTALSGSAKVSGKLNGPLDDPALTGTANLERLNVDSIEIGKLSNEYEIQDLVSGPKGALRSRLEHPKTVADLTTDFALTSPDRLDLSGLSLSIADAAVVSGKLTVPLDGMPITGALKGEVSDLSALSGLADQTADGSLNFTANLSGEENRQNAQVTLDASDLQADARDPDSLTVAALKATLSGRDLLRTASFDVQAEAADLTAGDFILDALEVDAQGTQETADFTFGLRKAAEPALDFTGGGRLELAADATLLTLAALEGNYEDRVLQLLQPLRVRQSGSDTRVEEFKLRLDDAELTGSADMNTTAADAQLRIKELPLDLLALLDPQLASGGVLDGEAKFSFAAGKAAGQFQFEATGAKPKDESFSNLPALNGLLTGELVGDRLAFNAEIAGLEDTSFEARASLPLRVTLDPLTAAIPDSEPLEADAKLSGDLAKLWPLLELDEHLLAGQLAADAQARGNLANPKLQGTATLSDGRYESLELGTLLTDMTLSAELDAVDQTAFTFAARDGDDGSLTAEGLISLPGGSGEPVIDISANLTRARLLRRDDILAQASGDIQVEGPLSAIAVTGDVATDLVEINIGGDLPASIVELPVEERNVPGQEAAELNGNHEQETAPSTTRLNLALSLPRRVFIRGRGLDSEWSGQFKITGTADNPQIEGALSPVRGNFTFAGKSFALQNGKVTIAGDDEIDPELDLSAVYEANGFKAIVAITGTASSPEITLSSEPELPQDEILAQVLFGKSTGQLSPVEALQLAEAVASVSGQLGSGEGILGLVRKTIGVDVLTAGTNETSGEVEVRAGKYVTDDVFVGVSQGTDPTSTKVTVEVEVTPNISVESDVGQDASGRVGVFWKFDY